MGVPMGIAAGGLAGLVGAALWAAIAYYANMEIGYLAWGIGAAVGFATAAGASARGPILGVIAVVITIVSICGGKLAIVEVGLQEFLAQQRESFESNIAEMTEETQVSYLADDVVAARAEAGNPVEWPDDVDPSQASTEAEYPVDVWSEAEKQWAGMDESARASHLEAVQSMSRRNFATFSSEVSGEYRLEGFKQTFGMMDLLFFGLAIFTAWGIAGNGDEGGDDA